MKGLEHMALQRTQEQRLAALADYDPAKHLIKIKAKDGTLKDYYPAAWRLYELNLRYPNANFASELLFFDLERNFCIVKTRLYLGADYDASDKKAEAMKSGPVTSLDKVETAAKARAARDFGISVEYALDMDDSDEDQTQRLATDEQMKRITAYCKSLQREQPHGELTVQEPDRLPRDLVQEYNRAGKKKSA